MAVWRNALHRSPTGKLGRHSARAHERTNARTHCTFAIGHELRRLKSPSPPLRPPPPPQLNHFLESRGYQPLYFAAATRAESRRLQHQPVDSHTLVPDGNVGGRDAATTVTAWQRTPTAGRLDSRTAPPPTVVGAQSGTARPARQANSYPKSRPQHGENPALQRARPTPAVAQHPICLLRRRRVRVAMQWWELWRTMQTGMRRPLHRRRPDRLRRRRTLMCVRKRRRQRPVRPRRLLRILRPCRGDERTPAASEPMQGDPARSTSIYQDRASAAVAVAGQPRTGERRAGWPKANRERCGSRSRAERPRSAGKRPGGGRRGQSPSRCDGGLRLQERSGARTAQSRRYAGKRLAGD